MSLKYNYINMFSKGIYSSDQDYRPDNFPVVSETSPLLKGPVKANHLVTHSNRGTPIGTYEAAEYNGPQVTSGLFNFQPAPPETHTFDVREEQQQQQLHGDKFLSTSPGLKPNSRLSQQNKDKKQRPSSHY